MKYWVGVTDNRWFEFLTERALDEVNFWQPSARPLFANPVVGMPFLFKLRRPRNHIAGGGFFVAHSKLPLSLAWDIFGEKNGASSLADLKHVVGADLGSDPDIGCTVLANPFFFSEFNWIPNPPGWASNIVRGKYYESREPDGKEIWSQVSRLIASPLATTNIVQEERGSISLAADDEKYGTDLIIKPRLGQSTFRVIVTDAYKRRCAMTGENTLVVLEAAHIVPYSHDGSGHDVQNGLLLRSDFHRLFDRGLVSVTPDYRIRISPRIRESYYNGKAYYRLDKQPLQILPDDPGLRPDRDRLDWHFQNCFQR